MWNEFLPYFKMGFWHLIGWKSILHILFVLTLSVGIDLKKWQKSLSLLTLFVLGNTVSIFLVSYQLSPVKQATINLLIPFTILILSLLNYLGTKLKNKTLPLLVLFISGSIHGFSFAKNIAFIYHQKQRVLFPITAYTFGIEAAVTTIVLFSILCVFILSTLSKVNKNGVNSILNILCMLFSIYLICSNFY